MKPKDLWLTALFPQLFFQNSSEGQRIALSAEAHWSNLTQAQKWKDKRIWSQLSHHIQQMSPGGMTSL
jgi:hypothetical protein